MNFAQIAPVKNRTDVHALCAKYVGLNPALWICFVSPSTS